MNVLVRVLKAGTHGSLSSIAGRLRLGFGVLVLLIMIAGAVGWVAVRGLSRAVRQEVAMVERNAQLASQLAGDVAREVEIGGQLVEEHDESVTETYRGLSVQAHGLQHVLVMRSGLLPEEISLLVRIDDGLSGLEVHYALAHILFDLKRLPAANRERLLARPMVQGVLDDIDGLGRLETARIQNGENALGRTATQRSAIFVSVIILALVLGAVTMQTTMRSITQPLAQLAEHAGRLRDGDLSAGTTAMLPGEFATLGEALNKAGRSLATVVGAAVGTADQVTYAATELLNASGRIAESAGQVASSMNELTTGAGGQAVALQEVDGVLRGIGEGADNVRVGVAEVAHLAAQIEDSARTKQSEVERALGILGDVGITVRRAGTEATALSAAAEEVNRFVDVVRSIANQTNLLALNAAIEAARAGDAGRGFRVVAEEIRTLATQARTSADEIAKTTRVVATHLMATTRAMSAGASRVGEIERLTQDVSSALVTVQGLAGQTRNTAGGVTGAAEDTTMAVRDAVASLGVIARTAESYAATAEEVSASTEEQRAACEEMTSASGELLEGSQKLRALVGGLKTV